MLKSILAGELSFYGRKKVSNTLFYNGTKVTDSIYLNFSFNEINYRFELEMTENNDLTFIDHGTMGLRKSSGYFSEIPPVEATGWRAYHFHDTSFSARIKNEHNISNCQVLLDDARNLAAFLYRLRENYNAEYKKIVKAIKRVAPYFKDFVLQPEEQNNELIFLRWQEKGWDDILNPSQLYDGTLRFICLATLLMQPPDLQPATIIIDEPELGLHPYAITIFAELVKKAANQKQIILATQSVELLDHFEVEDVIVVDRGDNGSEFKRLDAEKLAVWLEDDYTLGELWNKNIFGGRVAR